MPIRDLAVCQALRSSFHERPGVAVIYLADPESRRQDLIDDSIQDSGAFRGDWQDAVGRYQLVFPVRRPASRSAVGSGTLLYISVGELVLRAW